MDFDKNLDAALREIGIKSSENSSDEVRSVLRPEEAAQQIKNLMTYAENESVRLRAAELSLKISGFDFSENPKVENKSIIINILDKDIAAGSDALFDLLLPRSTAQHSTVQIEGDEK